MLEPAVGSRLTNFMGILSQGLRIAPPEAPATGYMFGKVSTRTVASELPEVMIWGGLTCWESQAFGRDHISFHSEEQAITRPAASLFLQTSPNARQGITFRVLKQLTNRHRCLKLVSLGLLVVSQPTSSDSVSGGRSYAKHHGRQGLASSVSNERDGLGPCVPRPFVSLFCLLPPPPPQGVYFADMVTKSANYCHANKKDNVALMLLADVALGTPLLLKGAKYMDKAPGHYRPPAISDSGALCVPSRAQLQRPQV